MRHLLTLQDYSKNEILRLVRRSLELKRIVRAGITPEHPSMSKFNTVAVPSVVGDKSVMMHVQRPPSFANRTLGMVFTKRSTRTRVSSETGWAFYGGQPLFLGKEDIQLGAGEPIRDTATVIGSMVDLLLARVGAHSEIQEFAQYSSVPVINALSDRYHPLQILADLTTLYEIYAPKALDESLGQFKPNGGDNDAPGDLPLLDGLHVVWIGDANNILHSMLAGMLPLGIRITAACPAGYDVDPDVLERATAASNPSSFELFRTPEQAIKDADVVVTDTWVSMGQESEKARRLREFASFQVTDKLVRSGGAKPNWKFMHCLPRKPEEVDDEVFYNPERSVVFQQAENRKYSVMAVYEFLMAQKQSN